MPVYDGKLLTVKLTVTVWGVPVKVEGTLEVLDVRREVEA